MSKEERLKLIETLGRNINSKNKKNKTFDYIAYLNRVRGALMAKGKLEDEVFK